MPRLSSPDWISRPLSVPDDSTQPIRRPKNEGIHNGWRVQVDPTPKKAQSFFARLKNFFIDLFLGKRKNLHMQFQRTVTPISVETMPATWTETECQWLKKFGEARIYIFSSYAKKYLENFPDSKIQQSMPAIIENYKEDFNQKCYQLRSQTACEKLPMSHMLYQAHWETSIRNECNSAYVKKFAKFMNQSDTSKAVDSWIGGVTHIGQPERPTVKSICNGLRDRDAIAVEVFLSASDEALLQVTERNAGHFGEVSEADPSLSSSKKIHASLQGKYLDVFCVEFEKYRKLDLKELPPVAIHIYLAHGAAVAKVLKPLPGLFGSSIFPNLENFIALNGKLPPDIKQSSQAWASRYP